MAVTNAIHIADYIVIGALIACMLWAGAMALYKSSIRLGRIASQATLKSNDLEPTRPTLSAIWIVTLCRPRGSSASSTNTPDGVGLAWASIRLVISNPKRPYLTRRLLTAILAPAAA